jgi:very-long-chain (3R)-3-hydroxyacyl-CoA dehydratase
LQTDLKWSVLPRLLYSAALANASSKARASPLYASCVIAWSVTEIIRYSFYALSLSTGVPRWLLWIRYTAFFALYPLGAGSEAFLIFSTLPNAGDALRRPSVFLDGVKNWVVDDWVRAGMFVIWWPGESVRVRVHELHELTWCLALYVLYTHMIRQRGKVIGGGRKLKTE